MRNAAGVLGAMCLCMALGNTVGAAQSGEGGAPGKAGNGTRPPARRIGSPERGTPSGIEKKLTLSLKDSPLRTVIDQIFAGSGLQYAIAPTVPDVPITLNIRDVGLQSALRTVIKIAASQVPNLTLTRSGDVWLVRIAEPAIRPGVGGREEPTEPVPMPYPEAAWEKVHLQYIDVSLLVPALGATLLETPGQRGFSSGFGRGSTPVPGGFGGSTGGFGGGGGLGAADAAPLVPDGIETILALRAENSLLVRGTPQGVQDLKQVLRLLDVPARQIRVRMSAGGLAAEGQGLNAASLRLSDGRGGDRLAAVIVPRVNGDGSVDLGITGALTLGGVERPLESRVRVQAGDAVHFLTLGEGARQVPVWIRATPLAEGEEPVERPEPRAPRPRTGAGGKAPSR